jgi:hypothetical protein
MGRRAQNIIDARLPARTERAIMLYPIGIKPEGDVLLGIIGARRIANSQRGPFQGPSQASS